MKKSTRRAMLSTLGLAAGASVLPGYASRAGSEPAAAKGVNNWRFVPLEAPAAAAAAFRLISEGGCMFGTFRAVLAAWLEKTGRAADSFPFHMMRYGAGGIGGWGTVCGTLNAGAALFGLFEPDKKNRERLIAELFSWYESTELPVYRAPDAICAQPAKSVAGSVLCHVSVAHWCKASGAAPLSKPMERRCSCLTADVTTKIIELLNRNHGSTPIPAAPKAAHDAPAEPPKAVSKMRCATCHER
jgi:hypothetical protein